MSAAEAAIDSRVGRPKRISFRRATASPFGVQPPMFAIHAGMSSNGKNDPPLIMSGTTILTDHVVAGHWDVADIAAKAKAGGGSVAVKTVGGAMLTFSVKAGHVYVTDEAGGTARITLPDVEQSNGVLRVVNKVLLPKM